MKAWPLLVVSVLVTSGCTMDTAAAPASQTPAVMNGQGEMAGEVSSTSILLQSRLTSVNSLVDGDVPGAAGVARFEVAESQDFTGARTTEWLRAVSNRDYIVKKRLDGLKPGTRYYYRAVFGADEKTTKAGPTRSFKTHPGREVAAETNFVVVTGMNYNAFYRGSRAYKGSDRALGYPALKTILAASPDFFVGTGDNVYYDSGAKHAQKPADMRRFWHEQMVQPRMVDMLGQVASYWEKDDHDTRYNDSDNTGDLEPGPQLGNNIFMEQVPLAEFEVASKTLPYRTYRVSKDLQIWMTEGREFRSPNMSNDPNKSMWGAEQLAWLKRTLAESDATFKILISPTPMVGPDDVNRIEFMGARRGAAALPASQTPAPATVPALPAAVAGVDELKRDNMTNPRGFKPERDGFFKWLKDNGVLQKNFYIVCGDRHWQYHSIDPSGVEEFSSGAIIDENSRMGRAPGDPLGNDPKSLIKQPYTSREPSGGFLKVTVQPGPTPKVLFRHYDEHGTELNAVTKTARATSGR